MGITSYLNHNQFNKWTEIEFLLFYREEYKKQNNRKNREATTLCDMQAVRDTWEELLWNRRDFKLYIVSSIANLKEEASIEKIFHSNKNRNLILTFQAMDV